MFWLASGRELIQKSAKLSHMLIIHHIEETETETNLPRPCARTVVAAAASNNTAAEKVFIVRSCVSEWSEKVSKRSLNMVSE